MSRYIFFYLLLLPMLSGAIKTSYSREINIDRHYQNVFSQQTQADFQAILDDAIDHKKLFGTSFYVTKDSLYWCGASGDMQTESQFFIASTTKLFTSSIIMIFRDRGMLNLDDPIGEYLPPQIMQNLHLYKGHDYSNEITIKHLLAHTSGLPDYFQQKNDKGISLESELILGNDLAWNPEGAIQRSKQLKPKFPPGKKGKANYSDTNYQLLGLIIEQVSGKSYRDVCQELIFDPLFMRQTYLYIDAKDTRPKDMYYKDKVLPIPKAMASFGPDGGIVSTAEELHYFLAAFFGGKLFPKEYLNEMKVWNPIFFPMRSGIGLHLFQLPWLFNPTGAVPKMYGHSGLSGTFAYYAPDDDVFITGTVNQIAYPSASFKLAIKLLARANKEKRKEE